MKNLNLLWNQLFTSFSDSGSSEPARRHHSQSRHRSKGRKFLNRLIYGRQYSEPPRSLSISSSSSSSAHSTRSHSPGSPLHCQLRHDRRTISCNQLTRSVSLRSESEPPICRASDQQPLSSRYQHPKFCQCNICQLHSQLRCHEKKKVRQSQIDIITEETEEEAASLCEAHLEYSRKGQHQIKGGKMDRVVPFQKPEKLQNLWQQAPAGLDDEPDVIKRTPRSVNGECRLHRKEKDNLSKLSVPTVMMQHRDRSPSPPEYFDDEGRCRSSASNFLRSHQLRSSCPPPSRPRRRSKTPSRSINGKVNYSLEPSQRDTQSNSHSSSTGGLVDKVQSKLKLSSVRKSWLFSLFQNNNSTNSKEKQSKWTKGDDDFEAEFFDRHRELTESLISRRSPLIFSPPAPSARDSRLSHQMSVPADNYRNIGNLPEQMAVSQSNRPLPLLSTNRDSLAGVASRAGSSRPRPRSACLDTYMLRMRNGNFIEFTVDNENQDESCSIISSANVQQHQLIGDYSFPSQTVASHTSASSSSGQPAHSHHFLNPQQQYSSSTATSELTNSSFVPNSSRQGHQPSPPRRPASIISDGVHHHHLGSVSSQPFNWLQPSTSSQPTMTTVTSNSSIFSSSPSLPKRNKPAATTITSTTTTATSSISSISSGIQMAPWSNNTSNHSSPNLRMLAGHSAIHVYWPVRNFTEISIGPSTTAFDVIANFLTSQLYTKVPNTPTSPAPSQMPSSSRYLHSYALRLICRSLNPNDHQWLHPSQNVRNFIDQNRGFFEKGWTLELRIRYVPPNLQQLFDDDFVTFKFLYDQVLEEFLMLDLPANCMLTYQDLIIELGCLELRRSNPFLTPQGLEKSSNFEALEGEIHKFLPASFITSLKSKQLRKLIKNKYKKIFAIQHKTAMFEFFRLIPQFVNYRREIFRCSLGDSAWSVPIDLTIGTDIGMAYFTGNSSPPTVIANTFDQIEQVSIVSHATMNRSTAEKGGHHHFGDDLNGASPIKKILLNIRIKNEDDTLVISCSSFAMAQSLADLIDGYHRLATNSRASVWLNATSDSDSSKGSSKSSGQNSLKSNFSESLEPRRAEVDFITPQIASPQQTMMHYSRSSIQTSTAEEANDDEGDYSNPVEVCTEICRDKLRIDQLIGTGQFGDVHRGLYFPPHLSGDSSVSVSSTKDAEPISVAVKISRVQNGSSVNNQSSTFDYFSADQKLLCEAERMNALEHSNIIKLIGVCSASPVYVVMELAQYGELRDFLQKHGPTLEHRLLIEYCMQIASALTYLESQQFVHRDIAARNILVFSFETVKLADFGLSRYIEDASYYMATNSKLPIKWMSPESINFRRFTTASDVWMFAVCMWEIFMLGKKPFQGVKNADVIGLIESGERLAKPPRCPEPLYQLMLKCWKYEPDKRPSFRYVKRNIKAVYQNELGLVGAIARMDQSQSSPKSSLSSLSGYNDKYQSSSASSSLSRNYAIASKKPVTDSYENNLSQCKSNSSLSASQVFDAQKIKAILSEQRKQMEEDSKWLAQNESHWQKNRFDSLNSTKSSEMNGAFCSEHNSTATSVYEDADCGAGARSDDIGTSSLHLRSTQSLNKSDQHLYSVPNLGKHSQKRISYGDESYNSFKSTTSLMASTNSNNPNSEHTPSTSSLDSNDYCGLSVSLKKFFKHNQLTDSKIRQEMMKQVKYASADMDRTNDAAYRSTIDVINSVRHLLKGVQEVNTSEYVDLVKSVGQELRNLLANVDSLLPELPEDSHWSIGVAQKKLTSDMNDLVEAMKKTIMHSETPMEDAYKQSMLETTYVLVIDTKNLLDTLDEVRIEQLAASMKDLPLSDDEQTDTATESQPSNETALEVAAKAPIKRAPKAEAEDDQIYVNEGVRGD